MSEISILSAQCEALGKTVGRINNAIIAFKKQLDMHEQGGDSKVSLEENELETANNNMIPFLDKLLLLEHPDEHTTQILPNNAAEQLMSTVVIQEGFFERIHEIRQAIDQHHFLNDDQFDLLDQIVETMDEERSELYKKLRAARG